MCADLRGGIMLWEDARVIYEHVYGPSKWMTWSSIKFNKEGSMKTGNKVAQKQHRLENDDSSGSRVAVDKRMSWITSYQLINDHEKTITTKKSTVKVNY